MFEVESMSNYFLFGLNFFKFDRCYTSRREKQKYISMRSKEMRVEDMSTKYKHANCTYARSP